MMRVAFAKAVKWYFVSFFILVGTTAMMIAEETGSMRPVIFCVGGYAFAYVVGTLWKEMKGRILGWSIAVFIGCTVLSSNLSPIFYILFGYEAQINKYFLWFVTTAVIGIPAMTYVFKRDR